MRTILEAYFQRMLCCALCKASLERSPDAYLCHDCGTRYPKKDGIIDFRVIGPEYARSLAQAQWIEGQKGFEHYASEVARRDNKEFYLAEIDSVTEIYTQDLPVFHGTILDVGGNRGTLRYFLNTNVKYLVVDPQINAFDGIDAQPGLLQAYPFLKNPCNFIAGFAENLPLQSRKFDFVHLRSVLDHVFDPYLAIKEAYRVLKDDGMVVIGTSLHNSVLPRKSSEPWGLRAYRRVLTALRSGGIPELTAVLYSKFKSPPDHHMWKWREDEILNLVQNSGFLVNKIIRQKPPFQYCIYMLCSKNQ